RNKEKTVAQDRRPAVDFLFFGSAVDITPDEPARARVQRIDGVAVRDIHDAIVDNRIGPQPACLGNMENPLGNQRAGIGRGDVFQQAVTLTAVVAGISQPVVAGPLEYIFVLHLRSGGLAENHSGPYYQKEPPGRRRRHCPRADSAALRKSRSGLVHYFFSSRGRMLW